MNASSLGWIREEDVRPPPRPTAVRRWFHVALIEVLVVVGIFMPFMPLPPWGNIYCPVRTEVDFWDNAACVSTKTWLGAPDHMVKDGRLYLRVQSTQAAMVLVTYLDAPTWDEQAVVDYRAHHPELDDLWPDASLANGGVRWLRR